MQYTERLCNCGAKIRSGKHCLDCLHERVAKQEHEYHYRRRQESDQEATRK